CAGESVRFRRPEPQHNSYTLRSLPQSNLRPAQFSSMHTTQFWLIRHGETQWNAERRLQGSLDIPLNSIGAEQADRLGQYLRSPRFGTRIDTVISSDLCRAYDTAVMAAGHYELPIERNPLLRERCYGVYEGKDWTSLVG